MDTTVHFLASIVATICGERRLGLTVTRDQSKVTCDGCKATLASTTIVRPDAVIDPVSPAPTSPVVPADHT